MEHIKLHVHGKVFTSVTNTELISDKQTVSNIRDMSLKIKIIFSNFYQLIIQLIINLQSPSYTQSGTRVNHCCQKLRQHTTDLKYEWSTQKHKHGCLLCTIIVQTCTYISENTDKAKLSLVQCVPYQQNKAGGNYSA